MRKLLMSILTVIPMISFGQLIDELPESKNDKLVYTEVVKLESYTKENLYLNSKQFFVEAFKSANDVIQMDDKVSAIIIGKGFTDIYSIMLGTSVPVKMWYTLKVQCKEGRYKYDIYDIYFENYPKKFALPDGYATSQTAEDIFDKSNYYKKNGKPLKQAANFKTQMIEKVELLRATVKKGMQKSASENDDNW